MKRCMLFVLSIVFVLFSVNSECATINNFAVSTGTYSIYSDVEDIIDSLFGQDYRLADWNDIVDYYQEGNDMGVFTSIIPGRTMVSYNGDRFYSPNRHYFINISNHNTPPNFLVHAHIDNHLIDLGSWYNDRFILAYIEKPGPLFVDVPPGYWAEEAIYKIYEAGITTGCSINPLKYCPENTVTRDQMAVFLGRAKHGTGFTPPDATGIFQDVDLNHWAADWIEQAYNDGITKGCSTNPLRYCPTADVTRAQMAAFLLRAKHGDSYKPPEATGIFSDVDLNHWAADWIEQAYNDGITKGCSTNPLRYCPDVSVTRAQMAVFLVRTFDL